MFIESTQTINATTMVFLTKKNENIFLNPNTLIKKENNVQSIFVIHLK